MAITVEDCRELDVNELNREGCLDVAQAGRSSWIREGDGEEAGSIGWRYRPGGPDESDALELFYTVTPTGYRGGEPRDVAYDVPIDWTECTFGGARPWFRCPECDTRRGKLYKHSGGDRFLCRECLDLIYESQTHTNGVVEAHRRLQTATNHIKDGPLTRGALREIYDAKCAVIQEHNAFREKWGHGPAFSRDLPPFDVWCDRLFHKTIGSRIRPYGELGRCTSTAKTTGERCRQPAIGEHGKCYYHGGAPGSGLGEGQTDRQAERRGQSPDGVDSKAPVEALSLH